MRGLKQNCMGRGHTNTHTQKYTNRQTLRLLNQPGPEGRVGEEEENVTRDTLHLTHDT